MALSIEHLKVDLRRLRKLLCVFLLPVRSFQHAFPGRIFFRVRRSMRHIHNFISKNFAVSSNNVQWRQVSQRPLQDRRNQRMRQLPICFRSASFQRLNGTGLLCSRIHLDLRSHFQRDSIHVLHQNLGRQRFPFLEIVIIRLLSRFSLRGV